MPDSPRTASIHRFRDRIGVHVGSGPTEYLTPRQARKLARALYVAAQDVDRRDFQSSDSIHVNATIELDPKET